MKTGAPKSLFVVVNKDGEPCECTGTGDYDWTVHVDREDAEDVLRDSDAHPESGYTDPDCDKGPHAVIEYVAVQPVVSSPATSEEGKADPWLDEPLTAEEKAAVERACAPSAVLIPMDEAFTPPPTPPGEKA